MEVREKLFSEKQTGSKDWAKSEEKKKEATSDAGRGERKGTCALRQRSSQCCFSSCVCSTVSLRLDSWVMSDW